MTEQNINDSDDSDTPILIDLGKKSRKKTKKLKKGEGPLMDEVEAAIAQIKTKLGPRGENLLPIVVLYEKKSKKKPFGLF